MSQLYIMTLPKSTLNNFRIHTRKVKVCLHSTNTHIQLKNNGRESPPIHIQISPITYNTLKNNIETKMDITQIKQKCIKLFIDRGALLYGDFTLNSGIKSNVFFNSGTISDAEAFAALVELMVKIIIDSKMEFDAVIGLPYKGIPLAGAICMKYWEKTGKCVSFGYHRKELKDHGEGSMFVGAQRMYAPGTKVIVIDDVLTSGKALFKGLDIIEPLGLTVVGVVVILNREVVYGTVAKKLAQRGINNIREALTLTELQNHA